MSQSTFTFELDAETEQAFRAMSSEERKKMQLLLRFRARELAFAVKSRARLGEAFLIHRFEFTSPPTL
jgi:hypothetical protein